jgi:hypothetical protein
LVEFRQIERSATPPLNADWVLIERARGRVAAKGALAGERGATFGPALFADLHSAIGASKVWAEENNVPIIYMKVAG